MTSPADLYQRAAACYEQAGYFERAADCLERAGLPAPAATRFEQTGNFSAAARCHLRAGQLHEAERCFLTLDMPEQAAAAWEDAGHLLQAAFILAMWSTRIEHARWLASEAMHTRGPASDGSAELRRLRLRAILALCDARATGDTASLAEILMLLEAALPGLTGSDRQLCETFCVAVADVPGRHDLAARILAASHRAGVPGAAARWRSWAYRTLGGITGIPGSTGAR